MAIWRGAQTDINPPGRLCPETLDRIDPLAKYLLALKEEIVVDRAGDPVLWAEKQLLRAVPGVR